jgi:antitoxin component YwqK of YwqJK toxin-antitoxin module
MLNNLDIINSLYNYYVEDDQFVYKSCESEWIVILRKLKDTITNENRWDIVNIKFAKFRANKLEVVLIINKNDPTIITKQISNSNYKSKITYKVGEIVIINDYDMNLSNVCSTGIHYFKTIECAYYFDNEKKCIGNYKKWFNDGTLCKQCYYDQNNNLIGDYNEWFDNGNYKKKCNYKDGLLNGEYKEWYRSSFFLYRCITSTYLNGNLEGTFYMWYEKGNYLWLKCEYQNGQLNGAYQKFHPNGKIWINANYVNGVRKKFTEYTKNGKILFDDII